MGPYFLTEKGFNFLIRFGLFSKEVTTGIIFEGCCLEKAGNVLSTWLSRGPTGPGRVNAGFFTLWPFHPGCTFLGPPFSQGGGLTVETYFFIFPGEGPPLFGGGCPHSV